MSHFREAAFSLDFAARKSDLVDKSIDFAALNCDFGLAKKSF